ncbi:MAG: L,D-transpeptidase [Candidatus Nanopelagicales bacterium]
MLPAAKWITATALVTPLAIAALGNAPVVAEPGGGPGSSTSPSTTPTVSPPPTSPSPDPSTPTTPAQTTPPMTPTPPPLTPSPTITPTTDPKLQLETALDSLGLPTGKVDGRLTKTTRRALCVYRDLNGRTATRKLARAQLRAEIIDATELPVLPRKLLGVKALVSLTCQATYVTDNKGVVLRVLPVSTGKDNGFHRTRPGFKRVYYKVNAWQRSSLFPEPDGRPGLYRPIYFDRGIAFHGVRKPIRTKPMSHGCVRTWPRQQDWLFKRLAVRDRVFVYGNYWRGRSAPLGGYGR